MRKSKSTESNLYALLFFISAGTAKHKLNAKGESQSYKENNYSKPSGAIKHLKRPF